jgi:hypothetical protein
VSSLYIEGVTSQRFVRTLLASVVLGAPFVLAAHAASAFVTPLTNTTVAALLQVTFPLSAAANAGLDSDAETETDEPAVVVIDAATKAPAKHVGKAPRKVQSSALFVSEATVLKLAQSAARPRGSFVAQTPQHPAGLRLSGVAALGIGLQEGDILIEALGIAPRAPGEIIGAILAARAKQARYLSGTLWRQGQTLRITVEQPYLDFTSAARAPGG